MDKERIAELRKRIYDGITPRNVTDDEVLHILDALEAALARAEREEARVRDLEALLSDRNGDVMHKNNRIEDLGAERDEALSLFSRDLPEEMAREISSCCIVSIPGVHLVWREAAARMLAAHTKPKEPRP